MAGDKGRELRGSCLLYDISDLSDLIYLIYSILDGERSLLMAGDKGGRLGGSCLLSDLSDLISDPRRREESPYGWRLREMMKGKRKE